MDCRTVIFEFPEQCHSWREKIPCAGNEIDAQTSMRFSTGREEKRWPNCAVRFELGNQRRAAHDGVNGPGRQLDARSWQRVSEYSAGDAADDGLLFDTQL